MKLLLLCFFLLATTVVFGQSTCRCNFPEADSTCRAIRQSGPGTCTSIATPCTRCVCDQTGIFTCNVEDDIRLVFNGTGNSCGLETGEKVTCPNVKPGIFTTCCRLQGEGSSDNVPCTLANWRSFVVGGDLAALRTYVQTNATLDYTAVNQDISTPGLASVSYDAGWTFQIPAGLPAYFENFQAFAYFNTINIPAGQATLSESQGLSNEANTRLPSENQGLFDAIKAVTTPITFAARYTGVTRTSNIPTIVSRFSGNACYEYTIVVPA